MKRILGSLGIVAVLGLTACAAPAEAVSPIEATETFLGAMAKVQLGDTIADKLKEEGFFGDVAQDLVDGCGSIGFPYAYASQIPDLEDIIISAYEVACPES